MWRRRTPTDIVNGQVAEGEHSDTLFVALVTLTFIGIGFLAFDFVLDGYTKHFGAPRELAVRAVAEAASSAASGVPSTAVADARAAWGQYGDYLGGMLNPLLSFFSFIALSLALMLQARQVGLSRTELRETRKERAEAQADAKAQVKAARTLAAAQLRTARAQERTAQLLARQLEEAAAAARAQEQTAVALMRQARIATLSTQLGQALFAKDEAIEDFKRARSSLDRGAKEAAGEAVNAVIAEVERLRRAIAAAEA